MWWWAINLLSSFLNKVKIGICFYVLKLVFLKKDSKEYYSRTRNSTSMLMKAKKDAYKNKGQLSVFFGTIEDKSCDATEKSLPQITEHNLLLSIWKFVVSSLASISREKVLVVHIIKLELFQKQLAEIVEQNKHQIQRNFCCMLSFILLSYQGIFGVLISLARELSKSHTKIFEQFTEYSSKWMVQ